MEQILTLCLGVGLSAACGFRVFVPLLIMNLAAQSGHLTLSPGFAWIGSQPALVVFAAATFLEIAAYYVPWLDHLLDTLAAPAAIIAGIIVTASCITGMSPLLKWVLAVIAGGGAASAVQAGTMLVRGASTALTGGLGNPAVSTTEAGGAVALSAAAIFVPVGALIFFVLFVLFAFHRFNTRSQYFVHS